MWNLNNGVYEDEKNYISLTKKESIIFDKLYINKGKIVNYKEWDKLLRENNFYVYEIPNAIARYVMQLNKKFKGIFTIINKKEFGYCLIEEE